MLSANADNMISLLQRLDDIKLIRAPINPVEVIFANHWHICTYLAFESTLVMTPKDMCEQISPRAFTFFSHQHNTYFIIYNSEHNSDQIQFSLCHEIGHILYGHVSSGTPVICRRDKDKPERDVLADEFAKFALQLNFPRKL